MIEFNCEHCGKELHLADNYAGRDGWCRVCKRMVIVPANGKTQHVDELPTAEGYERLQRLLQYAATKADKFKVHLAQQSQTERREEQLEVDLHAAYQQLAEKEQMISLAHAAEREMEEVHARKLDEAMAMIASLENALATTDTEQNTRKNAALQELEEALSTSQEETRALEMQLRAQEQELKELQEQGSSHGPESEAALEEITAECESLRRALEDKDVALEEANGEVHRLSERLTSQASPDDSSRADQEEISRLHEELNALKSTLREVSSERDSKVSEGAALQTELTKYREQIAGLEAAIQTKDESLGNLQARHEDRERTTREQIFALEEQVGLFDELTARVSSLQNKVSTLDQERIDLALQLEEAQRQQAVESRKLASLEQRLQEATDEKAAHLVQLEDAKRESACNEAQIQKLKEELHALTETQSSTTLEREKEVQRLRQNDVELSTLSASLEDAHSQLAEQKTAYRALEQQLSEQKEAYSHVEQQLASAHAEQARLVAQVAESDQSNSAETQALQESQSRIAALETQVREQQEQAETHRAEAEEMKRALRDSESQIQELEAELNELEDSVTTPLPNQSTTATLEEASETVETVFVADPVSDVQRQQERKQMMDVLSDFLDK